MSNYEVYIKQRALLESAIVDINLSLGRTKAGEYNSSNDKHELSFSIGEMGYGYYGCSSYYKIDNTLSKTYLAAACNSLCCEIGNTAIKIINKEIERLRQAAEAEARKVL